MGEGLKITLSALPGLTVDENGKQLLRQDFVFQCPPLEEFKVARAYVFGNYDTIEDGQFTRRGSRQLKTWQFDTLVMEMGTTTHARNGQFIPAGRLATADGRTDPAVRLAPQFDATARRSPGWVPFPVYDGSTRLPVPPAWFVKQLDAVHDAGCPFKLVASWAGGRDDKAFNQSADSLGPVLNTSAVMLGFTEGHKHGEGDAVYLESMSFSEWRNPTIARLGLGKSKQGPFKVKLYNNGTGMLSNGKLLKGPNGNIDTGVTAAWLSKHFYGDPGFWRQIFKANRLSGGSANTRLVDLPKFRALRGNADVKLTVIATLTIPALEATAPPVRQGSKPLLEQGSHS